MNKLIICVAPVGMWEKEKNNPLSPEEVAEETYRCYQKGATMVHLHVRDKDGNQTDDIEIFDETVKLIKQKCDIIIQGSTGGMSSLSAEQRCVALNVEGVQVATLNMGSVNFFDGVYINSFEDIEYWANKMKVRKIKPELCVFEAGMINNVNRLVEKRLLDEPMYYNFSLGFPGAMPANTKNLMLLIDQIPTNSPWLYVEHGMKNFLSIARAISLGGHIRVGFEDSIYLDETEEARENSELVEKAVCLSREMGREIANVDEARAIIGIIN
jgi:3-keto-5-aminohexanoate cleavage enzyme